MRCWKSRQKISLAICYLEIKFTCILFVSFYTGDHCPELLHLFGLAKKTLLPQFHEKLASWRVHFTFLNSYCKNVLLGIWISILVKEIHPKLTFLSLNLRKSRGIQSFFCWKPSKYREHKQKLNKKRGCFWVSDFWWIVPDFSQAIFFVEWR